MGGCCCCASRGPDQNRTSSFYYLPRVSEERQPLSAHHGSNSVLSAGLLFDTNLDTSIPSSYTPPPIPTPYNVNMGRPQTPPYTQQITSIKGNTELQTTDSSMAEMANSDDVTETTIKDRDINEMDGKGGTDSDISSEKLQNMGYLKQSKAVVSSFEEEDVCPTCLEEYVEENPKIVAKCEHHFHLACILEWMERSEACPICHKEMVFSSTNSPD